MGQPFTITGSVRRGDGGGLAGIRVVACDRDMPSVERLRGGEPQLLGDATANPDGVFRMQFDSDRYAGGEGSTSGPDVAFRVFDPAGREMTIEDVAAPGHDGGGPQILYNAANPLEVRLRVKVSSTGMGDSEYEQLIALIGPAIGQVALADLTDDDLIFLDHEFGWATDSEPARRAVLLRASSMLDRDTAITASAFYGWARTPVPDLWGDLPPFDEPARRDDYFTALLEALTDLDDAALIGALRHAADGHIIPAGLDDRAQAIVNQLKRRSRQRVTVSIALVSQLDDAPLPGYEVTVSDEAAAGRTLTTVISDIRGVFAVTYYAEPAHAADMRALQFSVTGPALDGPVHVSAQVSPPKSPDNPGLIVVKVPLPPVVSTLQQLSESGHLQLSDAALDALGAAGLHTYADIRRRGGAAALADLADLDHADVAALSAHTEMDRISDDPDETAALARRFDSIIAIADTPQRAFLAAVAVPDGVADQPDDTGVSRARAVELQAAARAQTQLLDMLVAGAAADLANGAGQ
jgi:hypothetical protein